MHASNTFFISRNSVLRLVSVSVGSVGVDVLLALNRSNKFPLLVVLMVAGRERMMVGVLKVALRVIKSGSGSDGGQSQGKDLLRE